MAIQRGTTVRLPLDLVKAIDCVRPHTSARNRTEYVLAWLRVAVKTDIEEFGLQDVTSRLHPTSNGNMGIPA